jgi:hypothetical protein
VSPRNLVQVNVEIGTLWGRKIPVDIQRVT